MFCSSTIRLWVKLFNYLLVLTGILIGSFAIYVAAVAFSQFFYLLMGVGVYFCIVGITGIMSINSHRGCCVNFYSFLFFLLIAMQSVLVIGFFFYEDKTIQILKDLNSDGSSDTIRDYLDSHRADLKYSSIVVLSVELFTFILTLCCTSRLAGLNPNLDELDDYVPLGPTVANNQFTTPETDARRAYLNEKYGGRFEKNSSNSLATYK